MSDDNFYANIINIDETPKITFGVFGGLSDGYE